MAFLSGVDCLTGSHGKLRPYALKGYSAWHREQKVPYSGLNRSVVLKADVFILHRSVVLKVDMFLLK